MNTKRTISVILFGLAAAMPAVVWSQEEEESAPSLQDTPYFSGMPNHRIIDANDKAFDEYRFYDGKDRITVEGKKLHRTYTLNEESEPASDLQISRNYGNAVKEMGGTVVFEGICEGAN